MSNLQEDIFDKNGVFREHIFSVDPIEEKFFSRPRGNMLTLSGSEQLLTQVLGINPRVDNSIETLIELSLVSGDLNINTNKVGCYYNDSLK